MLEFNPYFRKPASQILKYDAFECCRKKCPKLVCDAPEKISLDYDKKNTFDYTNESNFTTQFIDDLKSILLDEIKIIQT